MSSEPSASPPSAGTFDDLLKGNAEALFEALMHHLPIGLTVACGPDAKILRVSDAGASLLKRQRGELENIGVEMHSDAYQVSDPETGEIADPSRLPLTRATIGGEVVQGEEWLITAEDGRKVPILCNAGPLRDDTGQVIAGIIAWADLTKQKQLEAELKSALAVSETLMLELHHRVRNHLNVVASIVRSESRNCGEEARELGERLGQRLNALSDSYNALTANEISGVGAGEFLNRVSQPLTSEKIAVEIEADDDIEISSNAVPILGIIVNEAICNAIKHAFPGDGEGNIAVSLKRAEKGYRLEVRDNGKGLGEGVSRPGGTAMIAQLAQALDGSATLQSNEGEGATFAVDFNRI